jgi:uncharacterized membrane protein YqjE
LATGPFGALRRIGAHSATLLLSRAEFAALELAQARRQLMRWLLLALAVTVLFQLALVAAAAALTALLWDRFGPLTLVAIFFVSTGVGAVLVMRLQREIGSAPPLLSETLAELAKDRDALFGDDRAEATGRSPHDAG